MVDGNQTTDIWRWQRNTGLDLNNTISLRHFVGIDLGCEAVPDATTLLKFRRLLEKHNLNEQLFA